MIKLENIGVTFPNGTRALHNVNWTWTRSSSPPSSAPPGQASPRSSGC